jgi:hypothetical protein
MLEEEKKRKGHELSQLQELLRKTANGVVFEGESQSECSAKFSDYD